MSLLSVVHVGEKVKNVLIFSRMIEVSQTPMWIVIGCRKELSDVYCASASTLYHLALIPYSIPSMMRPSTVNIIARILISPICPIILLAV